MKPRRRPDRFKLAQPIAVDEYIVTVVLTRIGVTTPTHGTTLTNDVKFDWAGNQEGAEAYAVSDVELQFKGWVGHVLYVTVNGEDRT